MAWVKKTAMKDAVEAFLVTEDGKINLDASVEKFRSFALRHTASQESQDALILDCMSSLFNEYKGASLNLEFIKSQTVGKMAKRSSSLNDPTLFSLLSKRVEEVLHENTNQPAVEAKGDKPAVEEITGRIYTMKRGKGGGFTKVDDQSPAK